MTNDIPHDKKYHVGKVKFKQNPNDKADIESYVFDIIQEADYLTASCPELHLIVSAPDWESLEIKINSIYYDKVMEDEKNGS